MNKIKIPVIVFLIICIILPVLFTLKQMGYFYYDPKIEIKNSVEDPGAKTLRVVADYDFAPYSFYDKAGNVTGLNIELVNEIANRLNMKTQFMFADWPSCKKMIQRGEADIILGLEIFSDMNGVVKTIATGDDELVVFGKKRINSLASLYEKKVALMANSIIKRIYDFNCEYVEFYTNSEILEAVAEGKVDYGICHGAVARKIVESKQYDVVPSMSVMHSFPAIGVREDKEELRDMINEVLIHLSVEGVTKNLQQKWITNYTYKRSLLEVLMVESRFYTLYTFFFLFVIAVMGITYGLISQKDREFKSNLKIQNELKKKIEILNSVAGVYNTMHVINIRDNTVMEVTTSDLVKKYVNKDTDAVEQMRLVMRNTVVAEDVEMALNFTDLATIAQKMKNKDTLLAEFRGTEIGWFCAQFIAVERDEFGNLIEVMFTTQCIDEMKKEKERLLKLSAYDELTMLYNRRSYTAKLDKLKQNNNRNATIAVIDINQLKTVNDTYGHVAGDELISGVASIISKVFGPIGTCYRIGGDEFVVLIENEVSDIKSYEQQMRTLVSQWSGTNSLTMSISCGIASASEIPNFAITKYNELIKLADTRMYEDKTQFYKNIGIDRRGSN